LDVPNLYGQSQTWLRSVFRRVALGLPTPAPQLPCQLESFVRVYAVSAFIWRVFVYMGLILGAALLWRGAGIVLAVLALVVWFGIPLFRWTKTVWLTPASGPRPSWVRLATVLGGSTVVAALVGVYAPWPGAQASPAVVDYSPLWIRRAPINAWIERLYVESGEQVRQGQLLLELRSDELELEVARLDVDIQRAVMAIRRFEDERKPAEVQAERERLASLEKQRAELDGQQELLSVRAPAAGRVVSPRLAERLGTYLRQGEVLLQIGNEQRKEIRLAATQDDLDRLSHRLGQPVRVTTPGGGSIISHLERIKPRASTRPLHPALTAAVGGPLAVQRVEGDGSEEVEGNVKLLQPYFEAIVPLGAEAAQSLAAGQTVTVYLNGRRSSVGEHLLKSLTNWYRARTE
jgi:putative peptide zinc metalloprotease protein